MRTRYGGHDGAPVEPWKAQLRICECRDTFTLQRHLEKLWESCPATSPLQVGVWLFNRVPDEQHSLSLFDNDERQLRLSLVIDALNDRFGRGSVYLAGIQAVRDTRANPHRLHVNP